jgi:hypothetical protein
MAVRRERDELMRDPPVIEESDSTSGAIIPNQNKRLVQLPSLGSRFAVTLSGGRAGSPGSSLAKIQRNMDRAAMEARRAEGVLEKWAVLEGLRPGMEEDRQEDVARWMGVAGELIEDFKSVKAFFPYERGKRIEWFDEDGVGRAAKRQKTLEFETKVEDALTRVGEEGPSRVEESDVGFVLPESSEPRDFSKESFRGLEFEQWFYIFMQVPSLRFLRLTNSSPS